MPTLTPSVCVAAAVRRILAPLCGALLLVGSWSALAQSGPGTADDQPAGKARRPAADAKENVTIEASKPWLFNRQTRYAHSMPEVEGPAITVTKKTSVVKLEEQPVIIDNNQRELFDRLPGIVLAEMQNPTQVNISYRGLGNPQESEYVLLLQDGLPLELDWIGFPTAYYLPIPQTLDQVQMIRAGSGLLYGPEPQPVLNFVSKGADPRHLGGTFEQVGGGDNLFSSFNRVSGKVGRWDYLADFSRRQSNGQRANGDYSLSAGDFGLGYQIDDHQKLRFDAHVYTLQSGLAGLMLASQFHTDPNQTTTPSDREWTDRYTGVLTYENRFSDSDQLIQKIWSGYTDLITRSDRYTTGPMPTATCQDTPPVACATLAAQRFHYTGLDGRFLHRWARGNALTVGYTLYTSNSPQVQFTSTNPLVPREDLSGTVTYQNERSTRYGALFVENVFRLPGFHVVTSARLEHERISARETVATHSSLVNASYTRNVPLFGIGIGNDFGRGNETYLNISQGFRPLRYLDISSPFTNYTTQNSPDPTKYLTYEVGVHGWPLAGFYYDVSLFQVNVKDRIEAQAFSPTETIDVNTGNTRSRGVELETSYDLMRLWDGPAAMHLSVFFNGSYLDARFTSTVNPAQVGRVPAYSPRYVVKGGITLRRDDAYKLSLVLNSVGRQYFQDSDQAIVMNAGTVLEQGTPALIPGYTVADLSGEYVIAGHLRLLGGVSNLTDRTYYSRVFISRGMVEPARDRNFFAGMAYDF